ncbi:ABC transporter permease [Alteribacter keqinensis]|uniref:ABC transporter permease n=1 Tax=Alteribacter keqinensis TaxID=2483800 RepID=UPI003211BA46
MDERKLFNLFYKCTLIIGTGLILGGVALIEAIRYQIVISLSIFASVSLAAMLVTVIFYWYFFNKDMQLIGIVNEKKE